MSNKIKHIWSILAKSSSIDKESNNLSIFEILEEITIAANETDIKKSGSIKNFPYQLISLWKNLQGHDVNVAIQIVMKTPDNKDIGPISFNFIMPKDKQRMRTKINMNDFPITVAGEYILIVRAKTQDDSNYVDMGEVAVVVNKNIVANKEKQDSKAN